jgi:FkbM family methyltransferase
LLARLVDPGAVVVDAGANVGYMSVLLGYLAGQGGRVLSFEPHPELFQVLSENCQLAKASGVSASFELHSVALGTEPGTAELLLPAEFDSNDGTARIRTDSSSTERAISVPITTLNEVVGSASVDLMKLDVEGYELAVLQGAKKLLTENRLRHLVFEEHQIEGSEVVRFLQECGFSIFSLGWTMNRLSIQPVAVGNLATSYEAPSFVATRDAETLLARSQPSGWKVLRPIRVPRGSK